jgi:two-component system sensor histidine kinase QseC
MTRSLRSRLIVGMFLGMAVLLAAAGTTIYTIQRRQLYRAFDETLLNSANALVLLLHASPFGNLFDAEGLARLPAGQIREGALFQLWSDQPIALPPEGGWLPDEHPSPEPGVPGADWGPGPPRGPPPRESADWRRWREAEANGDGSFVFRSDQLGGADLPRLGPPGSQPRFERISLPDGTPGRAVGFQFQLPTRGPWPRRTPPALFTAVVAAGTSDLEKQLRFLAALLAGTALATMAISGGVAWLVVTRGLQPLAAVAREIAALDETGLKQRIAHDTVPREIQPVVKQLNGLLARLDRAFERERALTADVAHELRTPVAEVRAIAEITLGRPRDSEEYRHALGETLEVVKTLQGLIEKLLVLARLEAGEMPPDLQPVALQPALAQQWAHVRSRAEERGVTFEDQCAPETLISADLELVEVVLSNVLANAAAYTPDGGHISADCHKVEARCRLRIASSGCELSESEVARVFDRFWRADAARGRSGLNCGLGLTLVRRAMEVMGGCAEARVDEDRRFVLVLEFAAVDEREPDDPEDEARD